MEKNLNSEMEYSRNLKDELSRVQRDLQLAQKQRDETRETLEKVTAELKTLRSEKENIPEQSEVRKAKEFTMCKKNCFFFLRTLQLLSLWTSWTSLLRQNENVLTRSTPDRARRQKSAKRKYEVRFDSDITEIHEDGQRNVSEYYWRAIIIIICYYQ